MYDKVTIIIPTWNEQDNIQKLLPLLNKLYPNISIIVSDDGSPDNTQEIVKSFGKNVNLIDRTNEKIHGLSVSVMDGIFQSKTPYFIVMDADFQHPPEKIKEFINKLPNFDIIIGARSSLPNNWPFYRKFMSIGASSLGKIRLLMSLKTANDPVSGFFGGNVILCKEIIQKNNNTYVLKKYLILLLA